MHRRVPELVIGTLLVALLASYVVYTHRVVRDLQAEARRASQRYARVFRAQSDTSESASTQAMLDLARSIREQGVPRPPGRPRHRHCARLPSASTEWRIASSVSAASRGEMPSTYARSWNVLRTTSGSACRAWRTPWRST